MKKIIFPIVLVLLLSVFNACQKEVINPTIQNEVTVKFEGLNGQPIDLLSKAYFDTHTDQVQHQDKLETTTHAFLASLGNNEHFENKLPCHIQPIYAYGIEGVAYYEIWFTEDNKTVEGWVLVSATDKDYPIVNFSQGIPYSSRMKDQFNSSTKVYRFGVSYYALEENGQKINDYGLIPQVLANGNSDRSDSGEGDSSNEVTIDQTEPVEGEDYFTIENYDDLKQKFAATYFTVERANSAEQMTRSMAEEATDRSSYSYRWVSGSRCYFTQIQANTSVNGNNCWSGCNNNAWTNVYGWWDFNKGKSRLIPTSTAGVSSPRFRILATDQAVVDPVQMYLFDKCDTYCNNGGGWTYWKKMHNGRLYAGSKNYGYYYKYQWCNSSGCNVKLANITTEAIANNGELLVIGANAHMYVGYGWAQNPTNTQATWAYCYPGWSTNNSDDVWIWWKDFNATTRIKVY